MKIQASTQRLVIGVVLVLSILSLACFIPKEERMEGPAHCIDTRIYKTWNDVCTETRRYYSSPDSVDTLTVRLSYDDTPLFEMDAKCPFAGEGRQFYIHCCNGGFIWCEISSALPYHICHGEQYAEFFHTDKVQIGTWSELPRITDELKNTGVCSISISAEADFNLEAHHTHLRELCLYIPKRRVPAMYTSYIFICPDTPATLPVWMQDAFHDSPQFQQALQKLTDGSKTGRQFIQELIRLSNEHPRALAHCLLTGKSLYPDIRRNNRDNE